MIKFLKTISILSLISVLALIIWFWRPIETIDYNKILPENATGYIYFNLKHPGTGLKELLQKVPKSFTKNSSRWQEYATNITFHILLPQEIMGAIIYDPDQSEQLSWIGILREGKSIRLLELAVKFQQQEFKQKTKKINWQIKKDSLIFASSPLILKGNYPLLKDIIFLNKPQEIGSNELTIYLPNSNRNLSKLVKSLEKKNNFTFFPSIENVEKILLTATLINPDQAKGKISFSSYQISQTDQMGLDVIFLNNLLMRYLYANNLEYIGEVTTLANFVEINFSIKGLNKYWRKAGIK